jgi:hypothetical protein
MDHQKMSAIQENPVGIQPVLCSKTIYPLSFSSAATLALDKAVDKG